MAVKKKKADSLDFHVIKYSLFREDHGLNMWNVLAMVFWLKHFNDSKPPHTHKKNNKKTQTNNREQSTRTSPCNCQDENNGNKLKSKSQTERNQPFHIHYEVPMEDNARKFPAAVAEFEFRWGVQVLSDNDRGLGIGRIMHDMQTDTWLKYFGN